MAGHPIPRSLEASLSALDEVEHALTSGATDGDAMRVALQDFVASLSAVETAVETHPDGATPVPRDFLLTGEWARASEMLLGRALDGANELQKLSHASDLADAIEEAMASR